MQIFYDRRFLERAKTELRYDFGAQTRNVPMNSGTVVYFTRFSPLALATTALSEAQAPSFVDMTATTVSATLANYGSAVKVGDLYSMTSIEAGLTEHVGVMGQNAGETIDRLIRTELNSGATSAYPTTVSPGSASTAITAIRTSDTLTGLEVRNIVKKLKTAKARRFEGGLFRSIIGQYAAMDLMGNSEWLDAHRYTTADAIERGVVGKLHNVEFVETNDPLIALSAGFSTSATNVANVHTSFFFGSDAYGVVNLGSISAPKIYVKNPGSGSTDNPIDTFSTIGWKMPFAVKVLNSAWVYALKHGATGDFNAA
jgi:N4-gp56 family major capsid protein